MSNSFIVFKSTAFGLAAPLTSLALALVLGTGCGGGSHSNPPAPTPAPAAIRLEVDQTRGAVTAGRHIQLTARVLGTSDQRITWAVAEGNPGGISLTGLYYAPNEPGSYQVICRALAAPGVEERLTVLVHPEPVAVSLQVDHGHIPVGGSVTFTPEFMGGTGVLLPWGTALTSGAAVTVTPTESVVAVLRVTNALGIIDETHTHVRVGNTGVPPAPPTPAPVPPVPGSGGSSAPGSGAPSAPGSGAPSAPGSGAPSAPGSGAPSAPGSGAPSAPGSGALSMPGGLWGTGDPDVFAVLYSSANFTATVEPPAPQRPTLINTTGSPAPVIFSLASGQLPDQMRLEADGSIQGTPATPGQYVFTIQISNGERRAESGSIVYTVAAAGELTLNYPELPNLPVRTEMAALAPALANPTPGIPTRFSHSGDFPLGLHLAADGSLQGTPRREGRYTFTITARNWARSASATLNCQVLPGPAPRISYPDQRFDTEDEMLVPIDLQNLPASEGMRFTASGLPEGLGFDPQGNLAGRVATPGSYTFTVTVDDGIDTASSAPVTFRVEPFTPLAVNLTSSASILNPGERPLLNWSFTGIPVQASLSRNLLATPAEGVDVPDDLRPTLEIAAGDGSLQVPVTRRQDYTLRAEGRAKPGRRVPVFTRTVSLAVKGVEAVAGNPAQAFPAAGYLDGPAGIGSWRRITGGVYDSGRMLFGEGPDHTIRALDLAGLGVTRYAGVLRGPDEGIPFIQGGRLNNPGAMARFNDRLYILDRGSATLKTCPVGDPAALDILAGHSGMLVKGGAADGVGGHARFGTLMDLAIHPSGIAFVADLENGIRMVNLATGEVRTLAAVPGHIHGHPWPALRRPVALTLAGGLLILATETKPGAVNGGNPMLQALTPDRADLWNAAWSLNLFAGQESTGYSDGRNAAFNNPRGLAAVDGHLLIVDTGNAAIRDLDLATMAVTTLAGQVDDNTGAMKVGLRDGAGGQSHFRRPTRILPGRDAGQWFIVDQDETVLRELVRDADGVRVRTLREGGAVQALPHEPRNGLGDQARFKRPGSLVVDRKTGEAYVLDAGKLVRKVSLLGAPAQGNLPAIASGEVSTLIGSLNRARTGEELPPTSPLQGPTELGMDSRSRLFILEPKANAIRVRDRGELATFLQPLSEQLPLVGGKHPELRLHMAVRPGLAGLALAHSAYHQVRSGGLGAGWTVQLHLQPTPPGQPEVVAINLADEPQALAVDLDNRVQVLITDHAHQTCTVHTFARAAGGGYEETGQARFGPGVDQGRAFGLPEVTAMIADSKGNLFLADSANGLVWMMPAPYNGELFPIAGRPGAHQLPGPGTRGYHEPLYQPMGIAVTGADDLVVTCGDAVLQLTAPGDDGHPWTPVTRNLQWTGQGRQAPAPAPAAGAGPQAGNPSLGEMAGRQAARAFVKAVAAFDSAEVARAKGQDGQARPLFAFARDQFELFLAGLAEGPDTEEQRQAVNAYLAAIPAL